MKTMQEIFDKYQNGLKGALDKLETVSRFGADIARNNIRRVFFVGCGAPNRVMSSVRYWVDKYSENLETHLYFPAEFIEQQPAKLSSDSLVILISESGSTQEVVQAAQFVKENSDCQTISISSKEDAVIAQFTKHHFAYLQGMVGFEAKFMLLMAIMSSYLNEKGDWDLHTMIMKGIKALPEALALAEWTTIQKNDWLADLYKEEDFYMITASGPCYPVAYSLGVCILMEALWVRMFEGEAAEFFHGPFEIIDPTTPVILFIGEDPSRPIAERVKRFLENQTKKIIVYDSVEYRMEGIPEQARPMLAPYILGAASYGFADALSKRRGQPLTTRRYMGKVDY